MTYSVLNEGIGHRLRGRSPLDVDIDYAKRPKLTGHGGLETEIALVVRQAAENVSDTQKARENDGNLLRHEDAILAPIKRLSFLESHRHACVEGTVGARRRGAVRCDVGIKRHEVSVPLTLPGNLLEGHLGMNCLDGCLGARNVLAMDGSSVLASGNRSVNLLSPAGGNLGMSNVLGGLADDGVSVDMLNGYDGVQGESKTLVTTAKDTRRARVLDGKHGSRDISNALVVEGSSAGLLTGNNGGLNMSRGLNAVESIMLGAKRSATMNMGVETGMLGLKSSALLGDVGNSSGLLNGNNMGLVVSNMLVGKRSTRMVAKGGSAGLLSGDNRGLGVLNALAADASTTLVLKTSSAGLLNGSHSGMSISNVLVAKGGATLGAERSATLDGGNAWSSVGVVRAESSLLAIDQVESEGGEKLTKPECQKHCCYPRGFRRSWWYNRATQKSVYQGWHSTSDQRGHCCLGLGLELAF
jgi:hypothetical protein